MPLYEYKCQSCGAVFEVRQKFADELLQTHDACGGHLERLISAPSLHFKGTGWYVTDYANKSANGKGSAEKTESKESKSEAGASESAKSSEKSSEAKPVAPSSSTTDKKNEKKT